MPDQVSISAGKSISQRVQEMLGLTTMFDPSWVERSYILLDGKKHTLENRPAWNYISDNGRYRCWIFLLSGHTCVLYQDGELEDVDVQSVTTHLNQVLRTLERQDRNLVICFSDMKPIPRLARIHLLQALHLESQVWDRLIFCLPVPLHAFYKMYEQFAGSTGLQAELASSLPAALRRVSLQKTETPPQASREMPPLKSIDHYTKEELYQRLQQLTADRNAQTLHVQHQTQTLFKLISRISWDEHFTPAPINQLSAQDPFYHIFQAANLLQQDVYDMVKQFRELQASLEKQVEARTRELSFNEANLNALIENTQDPFMSIDTQYRVLVANTAYRNLTDVAYRVRVHPGMELLAHMPEHAIAYWKPRFDRALAGEAQHYTESVLIQGQQRDLEFSLNPIRDTDGTIHGMAYFMKDVTALQQTLRDVQAREQLLASINYSITEGIFRTMPNKGIVYVNQAFATMFGYDNPDELLSVDPSSLYVDAEMRQYFVEYMKEHTHFNNVEVEYMRRDGSRFWGLISSIKSYGPNGEIYFDGAIRDVTQLYEAHRELHKVNQELDKFVYSTSHDLRAPLVSIQGLVNITRMARDEAERSRYLDLIDRSITKLDGFINDIIGYSRNSRLAIKRDEIDFQKLIEDSLNSMQYMDQYSRIRKHVRVSGDRVFRSDPTRLQIILNNMLSNAIRYSDPNKPDPFLDIRIDVWAGRACIDIRDNGIGINPAYIDKIFDMFYRATRHSQGSGIGLYIVREAIQKLAGTIEVESQLGAGTTFRIEIPETADAEEEIEVTQAA